MAESDPVDLWAGLDVAWQPTPTCPSCGCTRCSCGRSVTRPEPTKPAVGGGSDLAESIGTATYDEWAIANSYSSITRRYNRTD